MSVKGRFLCDCGRNGADLVYETGFFAPEACMYISVPAGKYLIVSEMEYGRSVEQCKADVTVLTFASAAKLFELNDAAVNNVSLLAAAARKYGIWEWETSRDCPYGLCMDLLATRLKAGETFSGELIKLFPVMRFSPGRDVKNSDEIEKLRTAQGIGEAGFNKAIEILGASSVNEAGVLVWEGVELTSEILRGCINGEIARCGGVASHTIAAPGVQGANPHTVGYGLVHCNEPIVMDIFPRSDATGYYGDLTRTVVKGRASDVVKKAFAAVYDAQRTVLDMLKPGVKGAEAHQRAASVMRSHGFETDLSASVPFGFTHSLGHGVGLEIHEGPNLNTRNMSELEPGNVVTVEPGLYYPQWGGIRIEDMVVITEDGIDNLTTAPVFLELE